MVPLLLLAACRPDDPAVGDDPPVPIAQRTEDPFVIRLLDGPVDAAIPAGAGAVASQDGTSWWLTSRGDVVALGPASVPEAAAEAGGTLFVLDDGAISVWVGGALVDAGLPLPGDPIDLHGDGDASWIETTAGVVRWADDRLSSVSIEGAPAEGPLVTGGALYGEAVTWIAHQGAVHALAGDGASFAVFESHPIDDPIDGLGLADGVLLVAAGGALHVRDADGWSSPVTRSPAFDVRGGWVLGDGPAWWSDGALVAPASGPGVDTENLSPWRADALGRLLVRDLDGLSLTMVHRPLRLEGVAAGDEVSLARPLTLVPTAPDEVVGRSLVLRDDAGGELALTLDGDVAVLDPVGLAPGGWTVHAEVSYTGRSPAVVEVPVTLAPAGDATWTDHVRPIHEQSCAVCHEGTTETVLDGPEAWEARIDDILDQIGRGAMPLGGPPLSAVQVGLVQAWRDGGFAP